MSIPNKNIEGLLSGNHRYRKSQFPLLPITGDSSAVTLPKLADNPTLVSTTESEQKVRARRNKSKSRKTSSRPNKKTRKPRQDASRDHQPRTAGPSEKGGHESRARHRTSAQKTTAPKSAERPRRHVSLPARTEADIENAKLKAMMRDLSAHQEPRAAPARLHTRHVKPISNSPYASSVSHQSSKSSSRQSRDIMEAVTLFKEIRGEMPPMAHQENDTIDKARLQDYEHHYKQLVHGKTKRAASLNAPLRTQDRPRPRNVSCDDYSQAKPRYLPPLEDMKKEYEKYSRTVSKVKTSSKSKAAEDGEVAEKKCVKKKKILMVRHTKKSQQMQANMKKKTEATMTTQYLADANATAPNSARNRFIPTEEKAKKTTTYGKDVAEHPPKNSKELAAERRARAYAPRAASRAVSSISEAGSVSSVKSSHVNVALSKKSTKVAAKMPAHVDIKSKDPSNAIKSKKTTTTNIVPKAKAGMSQVNRVLAEKKTSLSTADKTKVSSAEKTKVSTGVSRVSAAEKGRVSSSVSRVSSARTSRLSSAIQSRIPVLSAQKNRVSSGEGRVSSGESRVSSGVSRVSSAKKSRVSSPEKSRLLSTEKSRVSSAEKTRILSAEKSKVVSTEKTRVLSTGKTRILSAEKTRVNSAEKSRASSASSKASESYDKDSFYSDTNSISSARSTSSTKAVGHTAKTITPRSRADVITSPRERSNATSRTSGLKADRAPAVSTAEHSGNHRKGSAQSDRVSPSRASHRASRDSVAGKATSRPGTAEHSDNHRKGSAHSDRVSPSRASHRASRDSVAGKATSRPGTAEHSDNLRKGSAQSDRVSPSRASHRASRDSVAGKATSRPGTAEHSDNLRKGSAHSDRVSPSRASHRASRDSVAGKATSRPGTAEHSDNLRKGSAHSDRVSPSRASHRASRDSVAGKATSRPGTAEQSDNHRKGSAHSDRVSPSRASHRASRDSVAGKATSRPGTAEHSDNLRKGSAHSDRVSPSRASHRASRDSVAGKATSRLGAVSARSSSPLGPDRPPSGYISSAVQKTSTLSGHADDDRASRRSSRRSSRPASGSASPADAGQFSPKDDTSDRPPSGKANKDARASASRAEQPSSPGTRASSPDNAKQNIKSPTSSCGQRSSRASVAPDVLSSRSSQSVSRPSATGDHIARDDIIASQRKRSPSPHRPCSKRASKTDRRTPRANSTTKESSPRPMTSSPDKDCLKTTRETDPRAYDAIDTGSAGNFKSPDRLSSRRGGQRDTRVSGSGHCLSREDVASPVRRKSATSDSAFSQRRLSRDLSKTSLDIDSEDVPNIDAKAKSSSRAGKASTGPDCKRANAASSRASTAHSSASRDDIASSHRKRSQSPCKGYRQGSCTTLNSPQDMSEEPSHLTRSSRNSRRSHVGSHRDQSPSTTTRSHERSRRDKSPSTTPKHDRKSARSQASATDVSEHIKARPPSGHRASSRPKSSIQDTADAPLISNGLISPSSAKGRSISRHSQEILPDIITPRELAAKSVRSSPRSVSKARSVSSSSTRTVTPAAQTYNCQEILATNPRPTSAASQGAMSTASQRPVSVVNLTAEAEAIERFSQRAMSAASQRMSVASQRAISAASQRVTSADSQKAMTTAIQSAMSATSKAMSAASASVTSLPRADAPMTFETKSPRDSMSGQTVRTPL